MVRQIFGIVSENPEYCISAYIYAWINMDFYQSLGHLILGTRMRRLSDYFLAEVNRVYQDQRIDFEASWFPLFYILSEERSDRPHSIRALADRIQISHSAVSQLVTSLRRKELIRTRPCPGDGRVQLVELTEKGHQLLQKVKPIWSGLRSAMNEIADEDQETASLLRHLTALEKKFDEKRLSDRIADNVISKHE